MIEYDTVIKFISITLLSVALTLSAAHEAQAVSWGYSLDSAIRSAESSGEPIMVDFYTDWCGWCKRLDNDTYMDSKVNDLSRKFICVKINAESDPAAARKYNVGSYPTILFLNSKGSVIGTIRGYQPPEAFAKSMEGILKQHDNTKPAPAGAAAPAAKKAAEAVKKPEPEKKKEPLFDYEGFKEKAKVKMEKMKNHNLQLDGIISHPKTPKAIINNKIVAVGDVVEGSKVVSIGKKKVDMLLKDGKKFTLKLK
ncbi:MAG: thioredoxin family protein [Candidatus Omnitrophota bacterium]|jgi:thioredoxin-related protein